MLILKTKTKHVFIKVTIYIGNINGFNNKSEKFVKIENVEFL